MKYVAIHKNNNRYEGVPINEKWLDFDLFYNDNIKRYIKAKNKWKNYHGVTPKKYSKAKTGRKIRYIIMIRKIKANGYFKNNTVFTSISDAMKYWNYTNKYMIENRLLGTRDIQNILKKKGIDKAMNTIAKQRKNGFNIFLPHKKGIYFWKGKYRDLHSISRMEDVNYGQLRQRLYQNDSKLVDEIAYCKGYKETKYNFEGKMLFPKEIIDIVHYRTGIKKTTLLGRFYKWGIDNIDKFECKKSDNKMSPYPKPVIIKNDNEEYIFKSVAELCRALGISVGNASNYANGKRKGKLKGYHLQYANQTT